MIKKSHRRKLSSNELMILVFTSEFLICFLCIYSRLLPLYALISVIGFLMSCWYYQDYKDSEPITNQFFAP